MRVRKLFAILVLAAAACAAENAPAVKKVIDIKYADMEFLNSVLRVFEPNHSGWTLDARSRVVIINTSEESARLIEDTIKRLDVPSAAPKDLELTAWFLTASTKESATGTPPPAELEKVVAQLRSTFAFKNYALVDALVLRTRTGQAAEASGTVGVDRSGTYNAPPMSQFKIRSATIATGEKGTIVRIDGLHVGLKVAVWNQNGPMTYVETGINGTDIDVAEGQKVVVGKSSLEGPDKALIVVLTVKIL